MSDDQNADLYWRKAIESLAGAESELANGRFNNATNRAYYAAFQAAFAALLDEGIRSHDDRWAHTFVHAEFVCRLINLRKLYAASLRRTLSDLQSLRNDADYHGAALRQRTAAQAVQRSRDFVETGSAVREQQ